MEGSILACEWDDNNDNNNISSLNGQEFFFNTEGRS